MTIACRGPKSLVTLVAFAGLALAGGCMPTATRCTICDCFEYEQGFRVSSNGPKKIPTTKCGKLTCEHPRAAHLTPEVTEDEELATVPGSSEEETFEVVTETP